MELGKYLLTIVLGYLFGSLSSSIFLSRNALGGDVRTKGSGNAGATNMARVYGWGAGVMTLLCDMLKAAAGEGLDEETAQILAMLPEETEGGLAYAKWREGREMRWICRISADELRALSNAVMMIWMSRMSGMDGLTFPGGI